MKYLGSLWLALTLWYEERTALMPFVGREAIYCEGFLIVYVKIARIAFSGTGNSKCMLIELKGLRTHGLRFREKISCGARLRYMSACYPSIWIGPPYGSWRLFFSPKVIDDVKAIVLKLSPGKTFCDDYPSEVLRALMDYIPKASFAEQTKGEVPLISLRSLAELRKRA